MLSTTQDSILPELAHKVDISPPYLSQIESGKRNPTVAALHGIATKLGMSLGELFEGL